MISSKLINAAVGRLEGKLKNTALTYDGHLNAYIKWENQQITGAFKVRGALNKVLALAPWEQERGLVAASAGNHGLGVAYAAKLVGAKATVFIPEYSVSNKEEAIREYGAEVIRIVGGYSKAEKEAQAFAIKRGATWISPYNDEQVIAGHATIGCEVVKAMKPFEIADCFVPVSGGGLISGIASAFEMLGKKVRLIGVQSENSSYFHSLFHYGTQKGVQDHPSIADGLSGAVERKSITIPLVRTMLHDFILVSETEIEQAIAYAWYHYNERIEGSAAATLAAVLSGRNNKEKSLIIFSGSNIEQELHKKICDKWKDHF